MRRYLIYILSIILLLSLTTGMYTVLTIVLTIVMFYCMLEKFGKGVVLLETMAVYGCVIYLLVPLLGYTVYTRQNKVTVLWQKTMPVPFETYYSFMLPAICTYLLGMFIINYSSGRRDEGKPLDMLIGNVRASLPQKSKKGIALVMIGISVYFLKTIIPASPFNAVASLSYLVIFPGLLYVYFQPKFKGKVWVYSLVGALIMRDAINSGMFTVLFYMGITIVSFFLLGRQIKFPVKLIVVFVGIAAVFTLQLVKGSFRKSTWKGDYAGSKAEVFQNLFIEKASALNEIFAPETFFPIYVRLNQGLTTGLVLKRIPALQSYDGGESIAMTLAASVVPRLFWPDKPESGGVYNMQHFAGFKLVGWSANIGPVGEGYGNFGVVGGIFYMFFFGLFIGWAYVLVFRKSIRMPLLVLWIPLLFFEVMYSMENDTLQALNSLIKAVVFMWLVNKLFPDLFSNRKEIKRPKTNENSPHYRDNGTGWSLPG